MTVATGETKMVPALLKITDDRAKIRSVVGFRFYGRDCDAQAIRADAVHRSPALTGTSISHPSLTPGPVPTPPESPVRMSGSSLAGTRQTAAKPFEPR